MPATPGRDGRRLTRGLLMAGLGVVLGATQPAAAQRAAGDIEAGLSVGGGIPLDDDGKERIRYVVLRWAEYFLTDVLHGGLGFGWAGNFDDVPANAVEARLNAVLGGHRLLPYAGVHVGTLVEIFTSDPRALGMAGGQAGVRVLIGERITLGVEAKYDATFTNMEDSFVTLSLGCSVLLASGEEPP